jgi:hypothetical protein
MSPRDSQKTVETDVASRLDRLPFSRWHWLIVAGLGVTWIRHWIPESPRWQATHGHNDDAEKTVKAVEDVVFSQTSDRPQGPVKKSRLKVRTHTPEAFLGVAAERKSLEEIATPLSHAGDEGAPQPA